MTRASTTGNPVSRKQASGKPGTGEIAARISAGAAGVDPAGAAPSDARQPAAPDRTRLPESAEHFEHVLRRLVVEKDRTRAIPRTDLR